MTQIICDNLNVTFPIYENANRSLKNMIIKNGLLRTKSNVHSDGVHALEKIQLEIKIGERVGLVGHNGSGKTTLLRVLSGIYHPTKGSLKIKGKAASLLDLSSGFDPDASGYENIFLRSILFGKSTKETEVLVEEIISFSELADFIHLPVRTYSSGMIMRLAFSISTAIQPDILLMDEWLSVGDESFNEKATSKLNDLVDNANILVIASHNEDIINKVCNRIITLEHGRIISDHKNVLSQ